MTWCDLCKAEKPGWISVKRKLPRIGQIVTVCYPSGYDGSPLYAWGARVGGGDDGWLWAIKSSRGGDIHVGMSAQWNGIEPDDDYPVTHWQPLLRPPFRAKKKTPAAITQEQRSEDGK